MSDNYAEETKPLFKMLRTEAFRFVLVHFNHYSLLTQLKEDLLQRFPDRAFFETDGKEVSYRELVDEYYKLATGFFLVNNFEGVLHDPEKYIGLNLRRDKLAKFPIALICFISPGAQELVEKDIMEKMPDLWSFRSFILNLKADISLLEKSSGSRIVSHRRTEKISSLGGYGSANKTLELQRLQHLVAETPVEEGALIKTLYEQIKDIQKDVGYYSDALDTLNSLKSVSEKKEDLANLYLEEGDLLTTIGQYAKALSAFNVAITLYLEYPESNKNELAIINERIGSLYQEMGNIEDASQYFTKYNAIEKELSEAYPENEKYKNNLAVSYAKLGQFYASVGNLHQALTYYEESNQLEKELYEVRPESVSFKNGLAISYQFIGHANFSLGDLSQALVNYEKFNHLEKQLYNDHPDNVSFKNALAISYQFLGNAQLSLGNLHNALDNYEKYNHLEKELYEDYPDNVSFKNGLAISYEKLGDIQSSLAHFDKALEYYEREIKLFKELYCSFPLNVSLKNGLAVSYSKLGVFFKENVPDKEKAFNYFERARELWEELATASPGYAEFKNNLDWVNVTLKELDEELKQKQSEETASE